MALACTVAFVVGWVGSPRIAGALVCGQQVLCRLDTNCELLAGSTCLKVGGLESLNTCAWPQSQAYTGSQCAQKFVGALGVCLIAAGGCGGGQGIENVNGW